MNIKVLLSSLIRHGLTALGALLVAKGVTDSAGANEIANWAEGLSGAAAFIGGLGWSYVRNHYFTKVADAVK